MYLRPVGFHKFRKSTLNTDFKAYRGCEGCKNTAYEGKNLLLPTHTLCFLSQNNLLEKKDFFPLHFDSFLFKGCSPIVSFFKKKEENNFKEKVQTENN